MHIHTKSDDINVVDTIFSHELKPLGYSPAELSAVMGISVSSLSRDRRNGCLGGIPYIEIGGRIVYPIEIVFQWFNEKTKRGHLDKSSDIEVVRRGRGRPVGTTKLSIHKFKAEQNKGSKL